MQIKALCAFLSGNDTLTAVLEAQELFRHSAETLRPLDRHPSGSLHLLELLLEVGSGRSDDQTRIRNLGFSPIDGNDNLIDCTTFLYIMEP